LVQLIDLNKKTFHAEARTERVRQTKVFWSFMKPLRFPGRGAARFVSLAALFASAVYPQAAPAPAHNVILFVADGLRAVSVTPESAPAMAGVRKNGVDFANSHSLYPTVTTANASAIATGHYLGDTGDFGNTLYFGFPIWARGGAPVTFLENDAVLGELNQHFGGNYLHEETLIGAARKAGFATAVLGKVGPSLIQDIEAKRDGGSIVIDDSFGRDGGLTIPPAILTDLRNSHLALQTPDTSAPDIEQEAYLAQVAAKVVLPRLKSSGKPFLMVFWSRDPDISQHNARDSFGQLEPGINGPTAHAAVRNADDTLASLLQALRSLGIEQATDIFVTADHGFATIAKSSTTSSARSGGGSGRGELAAGFLAVDIASGLHMPLYDPDAADRPVDLANGGAHGSNGIIGPDPGNPEIAVISNAGSDFIYLPRGDAKMLAPEVVRVLLTEDYVSGIFVNDALGEIPGTLPMSRINLIGSAVTPAPSIIVGFRSFSTSCDEPMVCTAAIADTPLREGQGNHGGFSRAETRNFMAAIGPDFKAGFVDEAPVGNADIAPTLARILGITLPSRGKLTGRVAGESLKNGQPVKYERQTIVSPRAENGQATILNLQRVGSTVYFDAAGFAGRTAGLEAPPQP
jgi:arylsulfatase A-like enzyme